jgi:hypothetical protein
MKVRRFTSAGGKKREEELPCVVPTAASGASDHYSVDLMIKVDTESYQAMVATLRLSPDEADELADRMKRHAVWCRQHAACETTCGPQRLGGAHVETCPLKRTS